MENFKLELVMFVSCGRQITEEQENLSVAKLCYKPYLWWVQITLRMLGRGSPSIKRSIFEAYAEVLFEK